MHRILQYTGHVSHIIGSCKGLGLFLHQTKSKELAHQQAHMHAWQKLRACMLAAAVERMGVSVSPSQQRRTGKLVQGPAHTQHGLLSIIKADARLAIEAAAVLQVPSEHT